MSRSTAILCCALFAPLAAAALANAKVAPPQVEQLTVKVALGCGFRTVRDHRGATVTVATYMDIVNTTNATIPIGTPVYFIRKRINQSPVQSVIPLYIKLDPGGHYELRATDNYFDTSFGCQAWIMQKRERSASP
jgi:hypothetical protein